MLVNLLIHYLLPLLRRAIVATIVRSIDILSRSIELSAIGVGIALTHINTRNRVIKQFLIRRVAIRINLLFLVLIELGLHRLLFILTIIFQLTLLNSRSALLTQAPTQTLLLLLLNLPRLFNLLLISRFRLLLDTISSILNLLITALSKQLFGQNFLENVIGGARLHELTEERLDGAHIVTLL